jgi:hypothetical protein
MMKLASSSKLLPYQVYYAFAPGQVKSGLQLPKTPATNMFELPTSSPKPEPAPFLTGLVLPILVRGLGQEQGPGRSSQDPQQVDRVISLPELGDVVNEAERLIVCHHQRPKSTPNRVSK